ncbi:DNA-3-methyladenine glycosylase family protein [Thermaerobacillus caldiproteolyticus]|uniref:DNA-3-methyladenine glycosylase II n=1 Tax=Thermaerobacillus caldiproteolyticus TaxID=247480 RepID=A0A7W0BZ80_9BACL|nr:DNA-3-methyladenine glycosylase [Anoxybacillus caldiproteolyticus]MBA2876486.1 DNA-3-methyladenine glycosylase II [Anoxybacillus caldiproteolyticus]QPA31349.1 DNA-3-methyladenine glycosylase 2 family protein [Anoxybacillus caldiproteolyticus]
MWQERIEVAAPYNFSRALERLALDPLSHVDVEQQQITVPLYIRDIPVAVSVQSIGTKDSPCFLVTAAHSPLKEEILTRISHIFQWDTPLTPIHAHFLKTELKPLFIKHEGTPLILEFDLYFCLMKCLIHQQLNLKFAYRLTERFVKTFGREIDGIWFYPRPEDIAALNYDELKKLQFSGRKAEYIIDTSKLIAAGKIKLDELAKASDEEITKTLLQIRGIGPWTVQNFLLFGLGRPNLFPKADIGLQRALQQLLHLNEKPSTEQMEAISKKWEPYLSYASLYLWRSIE